MGIFFFKDKVAEALSYVNVVRVHWDHTRDQTAPGVIKWNISFVMQGEIVL